MPCRSHPLARTLHMSDIGYNTNSVIELLHKTDSERHISSLRLILASGTEATTLESQNV